MNLLRLVLSMSVFRWERAYEDLDELLSSAELARVLGGGETNPEPEST